jgi:hypothetical protein
MCNMCRVQCLIWDVFLCRWKRKWWRWRRLGKFGTLQLRAIQPRINDAPTLIAIISSGVERAGSGELDASSRRKSRPDGGLQSYWDPTKRRPTNDCLIPSPDVLVPFGSSRTRTASPTWATPCTTAFIRRKLRNESNLQQSQSRTCGSFPASSPPSSRGSTWRHCGKSLGFG